MILVADADVGRAWRTHAAKTHEELYQFGSDLFLYAVDKKSLRNKGETFVVRSDPKIKAEKSAKIAQLKIGENWNPEPGGWRRMAAILHNQYKADITAEPVDLEKQTLAGFAIAPT